MSYPKECPVFEMVGDGTHMRNGALVEGLGPGRHRAFESHPAPGPEFDGFVSVRALDKADWWHLNEQYNKTCLEVAGFFGCCVAASKLRPLTPAAREMLALVTGE